MSINENELEKLRFSAEDAYENGNYEEAFRLFSELYGLTEFNPDPEVQTFLGIFYANGLGTDKDYIKAAALFHQDEMLGDHRSEYQRRRCFVKYILENMNDKTPKELYSLVYTFIQSVYKERDDVAEIVRDELEKLSVVFNSEKDSANAERFAQAKNISDRIRGCMIGGAAGDALGYEIEFLDENSIFFKYSDSGITEYELDSKTGKALISDDTQMTLFTANGLLYGETRAMMCGIAANPREYVRNAYMDWYSSQTNCFTPDNEEFSQSWIMNIPEIYSNRAPGTTCMSSLKTITDNFITCSDFISYAINNSKGCGGVMRVAPMGLCDYFKSIEQLDEEGAQIAAITHAHPLGYMPAAVLTHIIHRAVYSRDDDSLKEIVTDAINTVSQIFKSTPYILQLTELLNLAVELSENNQSDIENIHSLGEGWVGDEALAIAVYCALKYNNDFSKGIIAAVNHNGDSDSTGAICGNILGAWLGNEKIDDKWKNELELCDVILEIADDICSGCVMNSYNKVYDEAWDKKYIKVDWRR